MSLAQWVIADNHQASSIFGRGDENLKVIEAAFMVKLTGRGNVVAISGEDNAQSQAYEVLELMQEWLAAGLPIREDTVETAILAVKEGSQRAFLRLLTENIYTTTQGRIVRPKTLGQQAYVDAIRRNTLVFGIGPAGTGKTYLAMAMAVQALKAHEVERIILTRPAVEAGENLGFLPGDLESKVDPYLRPLMDALYEFIGPEGLERYRERGHIEIAPLAYMRGRTLNSSFIILDEAQNTTSAQMKMFLTRFGYGSRVVVTGDETQIDLPRGRGSGLIEAATILDGVSGIDIVRFSRRDVVRHPLIAKIVDAYHRYEGNGEAKEHENAT